MNHFIELCIAYVLFAAILNELMSLATLISTDEVTDIKPLVGDLLEHWNLTPLTSISATEVYIYIVPFLVLV